MNKNPAQIKGNSIAKEVVWQEAASFSWGAALRVFSVGDVQDNIE
jgi:hypothetical protein